MIPSPFRISEEFMKNPQWVKINYDHVAKLANDMLETGITPFPPQSTGENERQIIIKELVASSINYCYWYGKSTIRPNDCGSSLMYDLVNDSFSKINLSISIKACANRLAKKLSLNRFPLLEERIKHITEVATVGESLASDMHMGYINNQHKPEKDGGIYFKTLLESFPGFASDIFLKRASLFFLQLYRRLGWYEDMILFYLPVPADYQVPKMLRHFHCIKYLSPLGFMVDNGQLIHKGSLMECEIRAATILVCRELQSQTGWNISDVDSWLWLRRKECNTPFHLTITTDY
jgi:hypothetical protein